jgi:hypothetical protein
MCDAKSRRWRRRRAVNTSRETVPLQQHAPQVFPLTEQITTPPDPRRDGPYHGEPAAFNYYP